MFVYRIRQIWASHVNKVLLCLLANKNMRFIYRMRNVFQYLTVVLVNLVTM